MAKVIVCLSGGIDSAVLAMKAEKQEELIACLFFDYGQPAWQLEWGAAGRVGSLVGAKVERIRLPLCSMYMHMPSKIPGPRVVPFRNVVFAAMAANYAVEHEADSVWIGATKDDAHAYWDCKMDTALALSQIFTHEGIRVKYPLATMTKAEVVGLAKQLGVPLDITWSCYCPIGEQPCGRCNACIERQIGEKVS